MFNTCFGSECDAFKLVTMCQNDGVSGIRSVLNLPGIASEGCGQQPIWNSYVGVTHSAAKLGRSFSTKLGRALNTLNALSQHVCWHSLNLDGRVNVGCQAERGMIPAAFARRGPYGVSTSAIIASGTGVIFLGLLDFEAIVEILNLLCEFECDCEVPGTACYKSNRVCG